MREAPFLLSVHGREIAYGIGLPSFASPPPLTPPHKEEGGLAAAPRCVGVNDLRRNGGIGVSLPLVGRGQGWGFNAIGDFPAVNGEKKPAVIRGPRNGAWNETSGSPHD